MPSYNKNTQILKQQLIQKKKKKTWISPTMAIATIVEEFQAPLNKQLQTTYKKDNNLFYSTCCNFLIQKQIAIRRITKLNVLTINNNKYFYYI